MANQLGTLEQIALELANILSQVVRRFSYDELPETMAQFGMIFPPALLQNTTVNNTAKIISSLADELPEKVNELIAAVEAEDAQKIIEIGIDLLKDCVNLINAFKDFPDIIDAVRSAFPELGAAEFNAFSANFPRKFLDLIIVDQLDASPAIGGALTFFGLIERYDPFAGVNPDMLGFETVTIHYDRITRLLSEPDALFNELYDWGDASFDGSKLLPALNAVLSKIGIPSSYNPPSESSTALLEAYVIDVTPNIAFNPPGLNFKITVPFGGDIDQAVTLPHPAWQVHVKAHGEFAANITGSFQPPFNFTLNTPDASFSGGLEIDLVGGGSKPIVLLGKADSSRLEVGTISFGTGLLFNFDSASGSTRAEPFLNGALKAGRILVDASEGDGFINKILSGVKIDSNFDVGFVWSLATGIHFEGSSSIEIMLPVHMELGPLSIPEIYIVGGLRNSVIPIELSAALAVNLGPLKASVTRIGLLAEIELSGSGGNAGPAQIDFKFKPPNGVGLLIDASVVKGGGYLYFDFDKEEYAGVLELDLSGIVSVKAIGLITTKMPDGSQGFSLLLILTAEFGSPIQLGFGFTLSGVGGLLGLNRTMRLEVIATGIRDGGINSIMFPQNVVANAPQIISDLKKYFPVEEGTFLIGPMVKIGWGTPNLVTVSLGVIIEIPGNIAILGVLKVALPDEDAALIVIQVNFIGAIEFDKKRLWFFASIFESRVLFITLEGEMGLLVGWGDDSNFVVSVGGFHPAFNPPALPFGGIARIAISILNTDFARIRVEGYFAVTSNSVQFGASVELFFGVSAFNIDGHLGFDALFRFSPFYFIITISASLSVKVFGIGLFSVSMRGSLEGPTPWHVEGTGSISLLFFDIDVDFSHTWGSEAETTLPPISVMPLLTAEFQKLENWRAVLPVSNQLLVSLRKFEAGAADLVLHPVGSLKISQRAVPLGITIDKVGNQKPSDANYFDVTVNTTGVDEKGNIEEAFAVGQYFAKSDSALLNAKSFEPMKGGVELSVAGEQYHSTKAVRRVLRYEQIIIDTHYRRYVKQFHIWIASLFELFLNGNAVSLSVLSNKQKQKLEPFADKINVDKPLYSVAFNHDNSVFDNQSASFTSQVQAQEYMKQQIAKDSNLAQQLHVIPQVEMQRAA